MRLALFTILAGALLTLNGADQTAPKDTNVRKCDITRVIDGDTVVANIYLGCGVGLVDRHIRLTGVHAFESGTDTGDAETETLRQFLLTNQGAESVVEIDGTDKYGRILGTVWLGNRCLNAFMLAQPQGGR